MTFWEIYEKLCFNSGKKTNSVGKELGISSGTISQWKNGSVPSGEKLVQLADYFGVSVDYLLGIQDSPNKLKNSIKGNDNVQDIKNSAITINKNSSISKRDLELIEKINSLDFTDYADVINLINEKLK